MYTKLKIMQYFNQDEILFFKYILYYIGTTNGKGHVFNFLN